jgi:hypothetical protein
VLADSGNGSHLLYQVNLPNDEASRDLLKHCLEALAQRFNTAAVLVDLTTFNAARIWKVYGTLVCKGDPLPDRPHRLAAIWERPEEQEPVTVGLLQRLASAAPSQQSRPTPKASGGTAPLRSKGDYRTLDVVGWFQAHDHYGQRLEEGKHTVLCPWAKEHSDLRSAEASDTVIWEASDGRWPYFIAVTLTVSTGALKT